MLNSESIFVTEDFDEWKHGNCSVRDTAPPIPSEIEVFPEEVIGHVDGFMLSPVASANGTMLMACVNTVKTMQEAIEVFENLRAYCDVYLYKVSLRHVEVDGYTISDIILRFATTAKK